MTKKEDMEKLYVEFNFPGIVKFQLILKNHNITATYKEMTDIMNTFSVRELHAPVYDRKDKQQFITSIYPLEMVQIDLLDYSKYSTRNKNYKYILIGVDNFSRKAFAQPLKDKTPTQVLQAFKSWDILPTSVYHDSGNEFKGVFLKYLDDYDIMNITARIGNHHSLGVVDKFSRTFKTMISKYMTANNTANYIDVVDTLINIYNKTPHTSLLDYSPEEVMKNLRIQNGILELNLQKMKFNKQLDEINQSKIKIGDEVRLKLKKRGFGKGYEQTYSTETYNVLGFDENNILVDDDGTSRSVPFHEVKKSTATHIGEGSERAELDRLARVRNRLARENL